VRCAEQSPVPRTPLPARTALASSSPLAAVPPPAPTSTRSVATSSSSSCLDTDSASLHSVLAQSGQTWAQSVLADLDLLAATTMAAGASIDLTPALPHLPVGGRLRSFTPLWAAMIQDPFCTSLLHEGLIPDLIRVPPYRGPPPIRPLLPDQVTPVRDMLRELLQLNVIQRLSPDESVSPYVHQHCSGLAVWRPPSTLRPCFQTYFLVPKHDGGWRGCLDFRWLNQFVRSPHFKMDSMKTLRQLARPGDYMTSIDLRHAYMHCPLHDAYRQLHRFRHLDPDSGLPQSFEFSAMTFGLNCSPRIFTRLLRPVCSFLRRRYSIRLVCYLDDIAILGDSPARCSRDTAIVAECLRSLGFLLHTDKSELHPAQHGRTFLGLEPDFRAEHMCLRLPIKKRRDIRRGCSRLLSLASASLLSARSLARIIGKMVAARDAVTHAMLHSRSLQQLQASALRLGGWDKPSVSLSPAAIADLQW
jgi:hypothetical protein